VISAAGLGSSKDRLREGRAVKRLLLFALAGCSMGLVLPASALAVGTMTGQVFYDPPSGPNVPIAGVQVQLRTTANAAVGSPVTTNASGNYSLSAFANGSFTYKIRLYPNPTVPFSPVTPVSGEYTSVIPNDGATTTGLNFSVKGSTVSGLVFQDRDGNGTKNGTDSNLGGATVDLVGPVSKTLTSAVDGTFSTGSPILPAGSYTVTASKANYDATTSSQIASPAVGASATAPNLGLRFATGTVEGDVYAETNGIAGRQPGEPPIAGAAIAVSGTYDSVEPFTLNTASGADGTFSLPGVFVGTNRTIAAAQPAAYADGAEFTTMVGATAGADQFTTVTVAKDASSGRFQFGETGATIGGLTFSDCDADGLSDPGESALGSRGIAVAAAGFDQADVTSGADGTFSVAGLPGGGDVTLTPKTTSDATAPLAKIVQPAPGGTVGNVLFGYLGLCGGSGGPSGPTAGSGIAAGEASIVAGKRTNVRKSRLSLTCQLDRGALKSCAFAVRTKRKKGKVLARGTATAKGAPGRSLKVTLKLTKLGKARLEERAPKSLPGIATVNALDTTGQRLTATKSVRLRRR
jgi:hypothetical protein